MARFWRERGQVIHRHSKKWALCDAPRIATVKTPLWTQVTNEEFPLTAGKVQNLRAACLPLDGVEIPAGEIFSFWKQLGRTTRRKGFTTGRELRSGCLVPNLGGGLCQLSGLLHAAAIKAGLEVVERHQHSRQIPGATLSPDHDATIFWNYVDLRFRADFPWRIEAKLTASDLVISIKALQSAAASEKVPTVPMGQPVRAMADGDCLTCGVTSCFRHPSAIRDHVPTVGHTVYLLEAMWPEFQDWCYRHSHPGDHWLTPLDGKRWHKANYAWQTPADVTMKHATWSTLWRSYQQRKLPAQGAVRQEFLLNAHRQLAAFYARKIHPHARHIVVSQSLLPHLWLSGHLGGRTFDVLMQRWPLEKLQTQLDAAALQHPQSLTLVDFRAPEAILRAENEALQAAARIITPHRAIAQSFGARALLLDWTLPRLSTEKNPAVGATTAPSLVGDEMPPRWFFPASALARKGIYEVVPAFRETHHELLILGRATEGMADVLAGVKHRPASLADLPHCTGVVLPAWVEHEPRIALRALAMGIPVIASTSCGLMPHPLLYEIPTGDASALLMMMKNLANPAIA